MIETNKYITQGDAVIVAVISVAFVAAVYDFRSVLLEHTNENSKIKFADVCIFQPLVFLFLHWELKTVFSNSHVANSFNS